MERISPREPPYEEETAEELRKIMPPGMEPIRLFRILAHNPRVLGRIRRGGLLDRGSISLRERELIILRTTALCSAEYEWGVHVGFFARVAELSDAEIEATITGDGFTGKEHALIELCDALYADNTIDDGLWQTLASHYDPAQLIEMIVLAGQYRTISYLVNALHIELEPGAPRFMQAALKLEA